MKKGFLLLSLIIPRPSKVKNLDTYLALMVDEFKTLWDGVWAYDGRKTTGGIPRVFRLKVIYMWTIHDYPSKKSCTCLYIYFYYSILRLFVVLIFNSSTRVWFCKRAANSRLQGLLYMWPKFGGHG